MLKKIILCLCAIGVAYYSVKTYLLMGTISLDRKGNIYTQQENAMQLQYSLSTDKVELVERCSKLFNHEKDIVTLTSDSKVENKAILKVERRFPGGEINHILELHQKLKTQGCLDEEVSTFSYGSIKPR
ncbi:MAG: hypothetical protein K2P84_05475 [Undibacterium sp.]|nr:hypothetical protein [Undibacterium sp.]